MDHPRRRHERATSMLPPRFLLLGLGTVTFSIAGWAGTISGDPHAPLGTFLTVALYALSIGLLLAPLLIHAETPWPALQHSRLRDRAASLVLLWALLLSAVIGTGLVIVTLAENGDSTQIYNSDAAAFNHYNAQLVLSGENPYTADDHFWNALHQFPSVGATPLRRGRYASSRFGPSLTQLVQDAQHEQKHPAARGSEFAPVSLHSYPALAFLVYVPGVWAGNTNTAPTSLFYVGAFLFAAAWGAPKKLRLPIWILLLANQFLLVSAVRGSFEMVALLPALLAWRTLDRRWISPILLGLACAVKQIAWPLIPFYVIFIWRRNGPWEALRRLLLILAAFLLPNAPFIVASPRSWATSMVLPVSLPIFPSGIGIVAFAHANLLPLWTPTAYTVLEFTALAALLLWFALARRLPSPSVALVVGLLPILLSWHSAPAYFVTIPTLAVGVIIARLRDDKRAEELAAAMSRLPEIVALQATGKVSG